MFHITHITCSQKICTSIRIFLWACEHSSGRKYERWTYLQPGHSTNQQTTTDLNRKQTFWKTFSFVTSFNWSFCKRRSNEARYLTDDKMERTAAVGRDRFKSGVPWNSGTTEATHTDFRFLADDRTRRAVAAERRSLVTPVMQRNSLLYLNLLPTLFEPSVVVDRFLHVEKPSAHPS